MGLALTVLFLGIAFPIIYANRKAGLGGVIVLTGGAVIIAILLLSYEISDVVGLIVQGLLTMALIAFAIYCNIEKK